MSMRVGDESGRSRAESNDSGLAVVDAIPSPRGGEWRRAWRSFRHVFLIGVADDGWRYLLTGLVLWGVLIDSLRGLDVAWPGFALNRYSLFFALTGLVFVVTIGLCQRLEEPKAASMEALLRDILIESPQRVWVRLWPKA